MSDNAKKEKKPFTINPYILLFCVIIVVFIMSWFIPAGQFQREVIDGRTTVVAGSFQTIDNVEVGVFDIFRAVPNGLIGASNIIFLVLLVGGALALYGKIGAIPAGINVLIKTLGSKGDGMLVVVMIFWLFALLGGFLGFIEASIPFVPLIVPVILALGFDPITAVAAATLGAMIGFALGPTNFYNVGISHIIAELPMYSGIELRFVVYFVGCTTAMLWLMRYARMVKKDPTKSYMYGTGIDVSDLTASIKDTADVKMTGTHVIALILLLATFASVVIGMMFFDWGINDMTAAFLISGIAAGVLGRLQPSDLMATMLEGAKGSLPGALVVGLARSIQWMLERTQMLDSIVQGLSQMLYGLPPLGSLLGIFAAVTFINFFITSASGKALAIMPIIIPLADLIGVTRQQAVLAYQFGDGVFNVMCFTYGTLLIYLSYGRVPLTRWYKFVWPLTLILFVYAVIFLAIAVAINYS
ncbi:MAG: AbgT family transporter [Defluviitaleaceae bacterium]|nr:AbgT family transporter [Defluviitaleaceae bacterium]